MKNFNFKPKSAHSPGITTNGLIRLLVNLPVKDARLLKALARKQKTNKVTALVKAFKVLETLNVISSQGSRVEITHKSSSVDELLLP